MAGQGDWSLKSNVTLNDGVEMPLFGLGVYRALDEDCTQAVYHALQLGYRLIDTAEYYGNEAHVGKAVNKFLRHSGTCRNDVFVVTKLWDSHHGAAACREAFTEQLKKLDIGTIDLYLMHSPDGGKIVETYNEMLKLKEERKIRSVGVSNFGVQHLDELAAAGLPMPSVNQIELHPWQRQEAVVKYCRLNGIAVMGYSPLTKAKKLDDPQITAMARKYGKTNGQILIKYSVQMDYITIPKSSKPNRLEENAAVFDWRLTDDDMALLNTFPTWSCLRPATVL